MDLTDDGANMEIFLFATSTEIEVKERVWLYDGNDLVADIGGFLGLLLGASIYTLADLLLSNVEKFFVWIKVKHEKVGDFCFALK